PLGTRVAGCVVAPVLYYFRRAGPGRAREPAAPQLASVKPRAEAPPSTVPTLPAVTEPVGPRADDPRATTVPVRTVPVRQANAVAPSHVPAAEAVAPPRPSEPPTPSKPARAPDQEEMALLVKQG